MVVSHYWISGIQVAGLLVGLLGFFYLSLGLFGKSGLNFFRPLLPASAAAILLGVAFNFALGHVRDAAPPYIAVLTATTFLDGYIIGFFSQSGTTGTGWSYILRDSTGGMVVSVLIVVFSGVIIAATDSLGAFTWPPSETSILVTSEVGIATAATVATVAILTSLVRYLSERRLQYIGFTATVLAILTQFVPPVLDLLNIPVR